MWDVGLYHYLILAGLLFALGLYGVVSSRNVIRMLMCLEMMLNAVNINLVAFNHYLQPNELLGQVFAIFILTVSAAEASVGLAVVLALYRGKATVDVERFDALKG
jgi:NAD(P)H-quinone oxidoreductase subunit 4L